MKRINKYITGLIVSLSLASNVPCTHADHWVCSNYCKGQIVVLQAVDPSKDATLVASCAKAGIYIYVKQPITYLWDTDSVELFTFGGITHCWNYADSGTATPIMTWTPDGGPGTKSTEPPPLSVTVRETALVGASSGWAGSGDCSVSDGLGDPVITTKYSPSGQCPETGPIVSMLSHGTRIITKETHGSTVVMFDPVSLSAVSGWSNGSVVKFSSNLVSAVTATSTAGTLNPAAPAWFSGTACTATGTADLALYYGDTTLIPSGDYITRATLKINGYPVKVYPDDYIGVSPPSSQTSVPNLAVRFDSTHFADGSPITVEVEVYDVLGKSYKAHLTAPAYNKLLALGNQTLGDEAQNSVLAVEAVADTINYNVTHSLHDNVSTILGELPIYTAFYMDTHGNVNILSDCFYSPDDPTTQTGHYIHGSDVSNALSAKAQTYPSYNFAMFDACLVMGNKQDHPDQLDDASMAYGFDLSAGVDRAALGFDWETNSSSGNTQWTKRLWSYLAQGVPLRQAASLSSMDGSELGPGFLGIFDTSINPVIQGDSNMTLSGVYGYNTWVATPNAIPDMTWYIPL